jgi:hypothetical protein
MTKRLLIPAVTLVCLFLFANAFGQSNASLSGTVMDATQAVLPGATITATNTETGIAKTVVTNAAGQYAFAGMQVGMYKVAAEMSGFQTQTFKDIKLGNAAQVRLNFAMEIKKLEQQVEVSVQTENLILDTSASSGSKLDEKKVSELPIVNSNVLSLIKVMGGVNITENPIFGADDTQFAGVSASNVNLTRDGVTANDVRYSTGLNSPVYLNPEMVGEFKMVLAPVDAEMGRGNGQVSVVTRSGGNAYHGSLVWNNQNTALDANEWYENKIGRARDWRNQNEMTASVGGPIIKNKTFFFASWDQQISAIRQNNVNPQVPTPCARKGIFRYLTNVNGGNILTNQAGDGGPFTPYTPQNGTVNADGSPRTDIIVPGTTSPAGLNYLSVFGPLLKTPQTNDCSDVAIDSATGFPTSTWVNYSSPYDAVRTPDASGYIKKFMTYIPTPNNYQVGDGLNWAGYRWVRHLDGGDNVYGLGEGPNRKQINFRIDHNFNAMHRISGTYSWETNHGEDSFPTLPQNSYGGIITRKPQSFSVNLVSTIKPTLLNEARVGMMRTQSHVWNPLDNPATGATLKQTLLDLYPSTSGIPVIIGLGQTSGPGFAIASGTPTAAVNVWGSGRGNFGATWGGFDPRFTYADTLTWTKNRHSFRFGAETQRTRSYQEINGALSFTTGASVIPAVRGGDLVGSGFSANTGFHNPATGGAGAATPGMAGNFNYGGIGNVIPGAYRLLNLWAGNITNVDQYRFINTPTATSYNDITKGETTRVTDYRQNQLSFFMQDDWRVTDSLTLNLGMRYDWYGVPYIKGGMTAGMKGGATNIFGRSGNGFDDWMKPGTMNADGTVTYKGTDATMAFIGPDSPNPDGQIYNNDLNNFGPVFGFAYQLPWFGKGKTVLRGGYQLSYMPAGRADASAFTMPKLAYQTNYTPNSAMPYINLSNLGTLLPVVPMPSYIVPVASNPVLPVQQRSQTVTVYDPDLRTPYVQNLNMSVTRNITSNIILDVRYIGTLQRKQNGTINLNSANIWNNGLKEAFDAARSGGESALLDKMFNGINIAGYGYGPVGTTVNGVLQTGAMHLRAFTSTSANLANGNYIALAGSLATMNYTTTLPGNSGLPAIGTDTAGTVLRYNKYPENFIYTSPQFATANWTGNLNHSNYHSLQTQVTLRPTHGFNLQATYTWSKNLGQLGYTDPRNRSLDYGPNTMDRTHAVSINGGFELPFGPGRALLNGNNGIVSRIAGGWQMSWIGNVASGRPFTLTSTNTSLYANGVPNQVGPFNRQGSVVWKSGVGTGSYWYDEATGKDKYTLVADPQCNNITTAQSLRTQCTLRAVALASDTTQLIFTNPYPTERGNFAMNSMRQPGIWGADMAMSKIVKITEGKTLQIRLDATNIFNHAQPTAGATQSGVVRTRVPGAPAATMNYYYDGTDASYVYRPLGYMSSKVGARTFQAKVRFDF